jgi:hypothetical protein
MKKFLSVLLILSLILSMGTFTFAFDDYKDVHEVNYNGFDFYIPARLQQLEFDLALVSARGLTEENLTNIWASFRYDETLPEYVRRNILQARRALMHTVEEGWVADGAQAKAVHSDGTVVEIPSWSTVFPYWSYWQLTWLSIIEAESTIEGRLPSWQNIVVPWGTASASPVVPGTWTSSGHNVSIFNTSLTTPHYHMIVLRNDWEFVNSRAGMGPGSHVMVIGFGTGNRLTFRVASMHSSGRGSFSPFQH